MRKTEERIARILDKVKIQEREKKKRKNILLYSSLAACAALVLALNLWLFIPYTVGGYDLSSYKDSEYYTLMSKIGEMTYSPETTNHFEQFQMALKGATAGNEYMTPPTDSMQSSSAGETNPSHYEEVTNNQTAGVIEGDLFKRSSDYVYYLSRRPGQWKLIEEGGVKEIYVRPAYLLRTYSIKRGVYHFISEFEIAPQENHRFPFSDNDELYLSEDLKTVTVVLSEDESYSAKSYTTVVSIDVSDPASPREIGRAMASGFPVTSRMVNNTLFFFTRFGILLHPDFAKPEEYLPQFGTVGNMQPLPMENIYLPETADSASYLLVCSLDASTLALKDTSALFSYKPTVYVSENNIFATHEIRKESEASFPIANAQFKYHYGYTEIYKIGYHESGALSLDGSFEVHGVLNDQYSLDEYQNVLRVVTTSRDDCYDSQYSYATEEGVPDELQEILDANKDLERPKCNLYCIDLDDFSIISSIEDFSDPDESVKSVRFAGEKAYVCTATGDYGWNGGYDWNDNGMINIPVNDPVFEFDLSDLDNVTWTDTGTIPGYSLSLIEFTDGTLLGIGYGDSATTLKIELYRREGDKVISVTKFELENCSFATDFKAYFIDAEHGLVGLGVDRRDKSDEEYLLLRYDGVKFFEVGYTFEIAGGSYYYSGDLNRMRACYIDGYVYMFWDSRANIIYIG